VPLLLAFAAGAVALVLGLREPLPLGTLALAALVAAILLDEVVRGARARARGRGEDPATATWRLATRNRRRYGGYAVHLGVLVMAVGVAISSGLATDRTVTLALGETATIGEYRLTHERLVVEPLADDARVVETRAEVTYDGPQSGSLGTALRDYPSSPTAIATPAVRTSLGEDLYVTLLAADDATGAVTLHLFVNPLVVWIWIGGAVVGLGSVFAIWPDRRPRTVTVEERRPAAAVPVETA
jgi:cytochrome c-type biogenesis protein CcmF